MSQWPVLTCHPARGQRRVSPSGQIRTPGSDVGPAGRCATVADPTGATIAMWQAGDTEGYSFTGRPGTPIWFELVTTDMAAASSFYTEVF